MLRPDSQVALGPRSNVSSHECNLPPRGWQKVEEAFFNEQGAGDFKRFAFKGTAEEFRGCLR